MGQFNWYVLCNALFCEFLCSASSHRSRSDLVTHEEWHFRLLHYQRRREAYLRSWVRDREDLLLRCQVALEEEREAEREAQDHAFERQKQLDTCHLLHRKVHT